MKSTIVLTLGMLLLGADFVAAAPANESASAATISVFERATRGVGEQPALQAGNKRKKKKVQRRRTYTRRGNPEVTRKVSTKLLIEKLPELAKLVNLMPEPTAESDTVTVLQNDSEDADPTAAVPTAESIEGITAGDNSYQDDEMSEEEDPDQLTLDDEELLALQEEEMTIDAFYEEFTDYMKSLHGESHITENGIDMIVMMETLVDWLGTRYLFGGTTERGIDCSAFTRMMCRENGIKIPRTAAAQWDAQGSAVERDELSFGDLVFFHTRKAVYVSHVGLYLGNDMFCHASSRNGVTVSSLNSNYYSTHYIGARRFDFTEVIRDVQPVPQEMADTTDQDVALQLDLEGREK